MRTFKIIALVIGILAVIFLAGYLGIWVMLVGGIVQIIEAAGVSPVDALGVAIGIVRVLGAGFVGLLIFWLGTLVIGGIAIFSNR